MARGAREISDRSGCSSRCFCRFPTQKKLGDSGYNGLLEHTQLPSLRRDTEWFLSFVCTAVQAQIPRRFRRTDAAVSHPILRRLANRDILQFPGRTQPADTAVHPGKYLL